MPTLKTILPIAFLIAAPAYAENPGRNAKINGVSVGMTKSEVSKLFPGSCDKPKSRRRHYFLCRMVFPLKDGAFENVQQVRFDFKTKTAGWVHQRIRYKTEIDITKRVKDLEARYGRPDSKRHSSSISINSRTGRVTTVKDRIPGLTLIWGKGDCRDHKSDEAEGRICLEAGVQPKATSVTIETAEYYRNIRATK